MGEEKNRGAHGDSLLTLPSIDDLNRKPPPLQVGRARHFRQLSLLWAWGLSFPFHAADVSMWLNRDARHSYAFFGLVVERLGASWRA